MLLRPEKLLFTEIFSYYLLAEFNNVDITFSLKVWNLAACPINIFFHRSGCRYDSHAYIGHL